MASKSEIAEKIKETPNGSRELDEAISEWREEIPKCGNVLGWTRSSPGMYSRPTIGKDTWMEKWESPRYTSSVDAALCLIHDLPDPEPIIVSAMHIRQSLGWSASALPSAICLAVLKDDETDHENLNLIIEKLTFFMMERELSPLFNERGNLERHISEAERTNSFTWKSMFHHAELSVRCIQSLNKNVTLYKNICKVLLKNTDG